ncbi:hypothetical protein PAUR_b1126 [Pseudoalteromonas aurantia 208]|uniref:Uncharacterized protein n=1 Tax=Pseudoalteromonas aurantia 208 TaxID=1314867 RepID=A0ABR9EJ04_9GAMM|nr:hypothetical protein [Pseudoalteromonas aurantia 208]
MGHGVIARFSVDEGVIASGFITGRGELAFRRGVPITWQLFCFIC